MFTKLPPGILREIAYCMDVRQLVRLSTCTKTLDTLLRDDTVWKRLLRPLEGPSAPDTDRKDKAEQTSARELYRDLVCGQIFDPALRRIPRDSAAALPNWARRNRYYKYRGERRMQDVKLAFIGPCSSGKTTVIQTFAGGYQQAQAYYHQGETSVIALAGICGERIALTAGIEATEMDIVADRHPVHLTVTDVRGDIQDR